MADDGLGPSGGVLGKNKGGRPKGSWSAGQHVKPHGTRAAYRMHIAHGEPACGECQAWEAARAAGQADAARHRAQGKDAIRDEERFADPVWRAEFRGFVAADGWIGVTTTVRGGHRLYYATAAIELRDDDRPVLEAIAEVVGGSIWTQNHTTRKPTVAWRTRACPVDLRSWLV